MPQRLFFRIIWTERSVPKKVDIYMEKIEFITEDKEKVEFFVLEQAKLGGKNYILVTDAEEGDAEALILRETPIPGNKDVTYEIVDDDDELAALSTLFESLLEDVDIENGGSFEQ